MAASKPEAGQNCPTSRVGGKSTDDENLSMTVHKDKGQASSSQQAGVQHCNGWGGVFASARVGAVMLHLLDAVAIAEATSMPVL
mmetsp:Transcript_70906/g.147771  ORF Transcript_70906/g.147771 Transcript_70906/m.147771 type:complete len:84 (-) Transcript_70906:335-586(-)